ncbi:phosphotransferase [Cohnella boryungensis]|uniref:Phosphotransferase n=1 Tax=Cohnella boryungensis TaxID=768479 RepID=A0ABV8SH21_9BACL
MPFDTILECYFPDGQWEIEQGHTGWNNTTRYINAEGRRWVLRIYETHKDERKVRYEHLLLTALNEMPLSFRVPCPARLPAGDTFIRLTDGSERLACLFAYIEGVRPEEDVFNVVQLGTAAGELMQALAGLSLPESPVYPPYYEMDSAYPLCTPDSLAAFCGDPPAELQGEKPELKLIEAEIRSFRTLLPRFRSLPHQLVHGDINASNALSTRETGGRIAAILDFEFCTWDLRAMEVAVLLSGFLNGESAMEKIESFLQGAGQRVRMSPAELEAIPALIRLRALDVFLHFLNRYLEGIDGAAVIREQTLSVAEGIRKLDELREPLEQAVQRYLTS